MSRRRSLMTAQASEPAWEEIQFSLSSFTPNSGTGKVVSGSSIQVYNTTNGTYKNAALDFTTQSGYEYRYTAHISVTTGKGFIGCRTSGGQMVSGTTQGSYSAGTDIDVDKTFQHNSTIASLNIFSTWSTSEKGDVTYSNLKLYRRPL